MIAELMVKDTEGPTGGLEKAEFLLSQGADPRKVMIRHVTNSRDIDYHRTILAKGVSVGFDRLGLAIVYGVPDEISIQNIAQLCKEGFVDKIMLSYDTINYWLGRPNIPKKAAQLFKDWRIDHVSKDLISRGGAAVGETAKSRYKSLNKAVKKGGD
jgi:phosphotriesterase-related protein